MEKVKNVRKNYRSYSIAFKMKLVDEIENGILSQNEACKMYKISSSTLSGWVTKYGINEQIDKKVIIMTREEESELLMLRRENKQLKRSLEDSQIRSLAYECLVDEASKYTKIDLKKNFGLIVRKVVRQRLKGEDLDEKD